MEESDRPNGSLSKTTQLLPIIAAFAAVMGAWFYVKGDASAAREAAEFVRQENRDIKKEVLENERATAAALATVNLRLERIQTILERLDKDLPTRVRSEVRESLKEK